MKVFLKYINVSENEILVEQILSEECYKDWLNSKKNHPKRPQEAFRKTLTGHVRGDNGLEPFNYKVESEILKMLRKNEIWPCFTNTGLKIGKRGFQSKGFWERQRLLKRNSSETIKSEPILNEDNVKLEFNVFDEDNRQYDKKLKQTIEEECFFDVFELLL